MKKLILGLAMAFAATAEADVAKEYTISDSLTATLDDQGALTIIGSGAMPDWQLSSEQVWADERSQIKSVVGEGEITIGEESIAAPSAGTVKVEDGKVRLGVTVLKTSDLTAAKKDWSKVKISREDIDVDADGNIIVNVPVDSQSGFMVIQTKDAKVGD